MAETALELALPPEGAARLFRHAAIAARPRGAAVSASLHTSADGALDEAGLAVMVSKRRRGAVQRLVRAMPEGDAAWLPGAPMPVLAETPLPAPTPDLAMLAAHAGLAAGAEPQGLAELTGRTGTAEVRGVRLALLAGTLRAVSAEKPVAQLTLTGDREAVFALAAALAADLPLTLPATTLAEEARALARNGAPRPLRDGAPRIPRGASTAEAFSAVVSHLTLAMLANVPAAHAGETPVGVHQTRVALRRLRSALSLFKDLAGPEGAAASAGLKALAACLGPARDWDVFLGGRLAELAAAFAGDDRIAALRDDAEAEREAAYAALRTALDAPRFRLLCLSLASLARAPLDAPEPATGFAARALNRRLKRVLRHGEDLTGLPAPELHALRLDAKRLRYAGEMFGPLYGERKVRRFLRALAAVQEELGHLNDIAVATALLDHLDRPDPGRAFAIGAVEGWIAAKADGAREAAFAAWERFLGRDLFWDG
jgi:CHAD domain-containing protein